MTDDGDDFLLRLYRRYIGDPERDIDVYAGFGLFFAGIALGLAGVAVFLWSTTLPAGESRMFAVREVAVVASAIGLPVLLGSIVVLLPVDRRMLAVTAVGGAICAGATGLFAWAYPKAWNVQNPPDYSAEGVAVYSLGIVLVVGATGSALVANRLERARVAEGATAEGDDGPAVTDEEVAADIERELANTEISWGGIERTETRRLTFEDPDTDDLDTGGLESGPAITRASGDDVENAVQELRGLQGQEPETASGGGTDDQTAALRELRERQDDAEETPSGPLARLRNLF